MKIGLSYSRCLRDIVEGVVDIKDVLVIITRTNFDPHDDLEWSSIWSGYGGGSSGGGGWSRPEWGAYTAQDEQKFRDLSLRLYDSGKMHQPRKFGASPVQMPYIWLETVLPSSELDANPTLRESWEVFQTVAGLSGVKLDKESH